MARYTEVKAAEAAQLAQYHPSEEFAAMPDFESFASYAAKARSNTLSELKEADLATWKRTVGIPSARSRDSCSIGSIQNGRTPIFKGMLSTASYFEITK
jgi:hypothetical protein